MTYTVTDIGKALQAARDRIGLTQRAFAAQASTTQARVSKIENGETDARLSTILELGRHLDLELMLVPREHIPAIKGLLSNQISKASDNTARDALDRMRTLIVQLKRQFPTNEQLDRIEKAAKELANFRLTASRTSMIQRLTEDLRLVQKTPALASTFDTHASALRQLRNEIAHSVSDEMIAPRPAYSLDDDDDG
jgi:transcriptional regulator with XRE-family HTH domain